MQLGLVPKLQGSFSAWVDLRRARLGAKAIGFDFAALPGWRAAQWVDDRGCARTLDPFRALREPDRRRRDMA
jgi:hypothetical protein